MQAAFDSARVGAGTVQFVGDVQRRDDGDAQRVGTGEFARRAPHFFVEETGELRDVLRIQVAADRVALAVNLDVYDLGHGQTQRFNLSIWAII